MEVRLARIRAALPARLSRRAPLPSLRRRQPDTLQRREGVDGRIPTLEPLPDHPISARETAGIEKAIWKVLEEVRSDVEVRVFRNGFGGKVYGYDVYGPTGDQKAKAIALISKELAQQGLPTHVCDSGRPFSVHAEGTHKGVALMHFARTQGVPVDGIYKFGNKAAKHGNDTPLLYGKNAYNVGDEPSHQGDVFDLVKKGASGVAGVLRARREACMPVRAIATDLDGTVVDPPNREIDANVARELMHLLRSGGKLAVVTGRGESAINCVLTPLRREGLSAEELRSITFYLFNGAKGVTLTRFPSRAQQLVRRKGRRRLQP